MRKPATTGCCAFWSPANSQAGSHVVAKRQATTWLTHVSQRFQTLPPAASRRTDLARTDCSLKFVKKVQLLQLLGWLGNFKRTPSKGYFQKVQPSVLQAGQLFFRGRAPSSWQNGSTLSFPQLWFTVLPVAWRHFFYRNHFVSCH